jgi:acetyl-CoA acetyltransferase
MDAYRASPVVSDPLRVLDCCLVNDGAAAFIMTRQDRAKDLRQRPVHVLGVARSQAAYTGYSAFSQREVRTEAVRSAPSAFRQAGIANVSDVDVVELYDCYTFTVLLTLEDYGFCAKGDGGPFVASGVLGPAGKLRLNTGGGQLSGYYMWGMTPLSEAVIQARGQGGDRQSDLHDIVLVSGNGGVLDHHSTLVLASEAGAA